MLISYVFFFFFKQKTAYEIMPSLVGSEMCIRDSGFCYDDVNDQSTLLQYDSADALVIDLKW